MTCLHLLGRRGFGLLLSVLLLQGDPASPLAQDNVGNGSLTIRDGSWDNVLASARANPYIFRLSSSVPSRSMAASLILI